MLVAVVGATVGLGRVRPGRRRCRDRRHAPPGGPDPGPALDQLVGRRPAPRRRSRHHDGVAHRHHRHRRRSFAARRGDEVDADQEMVGMGTANVAAGLFQGFAVSVSGSRTAVADQAGARSQATGPGRRRTGRPVAAVPQRAARRPPPDRAGRRGHRRRAVAHGPRRAAPLRRDPPLVAGHQPRRRRRCDLPRGAPGHRRGHRPGGAAVLPAQLVAARQPCSARCPSVGGWHSITESPRRPAAARHRRVPLGGAAVLRQRRPVPRPGPRPRPGPASPAGWSCSARPSPTSTSPRPRCSATSTRSSTPRACTSPSSSSAAASRTSIQRYGLHTTLDQEHFYPSLDQALADIAPTPLRPTTGTIATTPEGAP